MHMCVYIYIYTYIHIHILGFRLLDSLGGQLLFVHCLSVQVVVWLYDWFVWHVHLSVLVRTCSHACRWYLTLYHQCRQLSAQSADSESPNLRAETSMLRLPSDKDCSIARQWRAGSRQPSPTLYWSHPTPLAAAEVHTQRRGVYWQVSLRENR